MPKKQIEKIKEDIKVEKKSKVKLISYEIKAVIPTVQYGNIQPCIIVEAPSIEEAEKYVLPHIEALHKKYLNENFSNIPYSPSVPTNIKVAESNVTMHNTGENASPKFLEPTSDEEIKRLSSLNQPTRSSAFLKAEQAINSCTNLDAIELVRERLIKSEKLTGDEKDALYVVLANKKETIK